MSRPGSNRARLGLGTAQFGLDYGVANREGQVPLDAVSTILDAANRASMAILDTAAAYGNSEEILGRSLSAAHSFKIVTKVLPLGREQLSTSDIDQALQAFERSLDHIRVDSVYGLLLHDAEDILVPGGEKLFEKLQKLKNDRKVEKIGVSVYTGCQIDAVLERYEIDLVQLPINIFDQRLHSAGYLKRLKSAGVEIHARSIFLQGLLLMSPDEVPPYFDPIRSHLTSYHDAIRRAGLSPLEAALNFVLSLDEIDAAIVGVCSAGQLNEIVEASDNPRDLSDSLRFALAREEMLNPAKWKVCEHENQSS